MVAITSSKSGSLEIQSASLPPRYYNNLKNARIEGFNPFLSDGVTTNPYATICILAEGQYILKDVYLNNVTIGGSSPATLAAALDSLNTYIAE